MMELNIPEVVAEVRAAFERYDAGLDANDVAVLDDSFWDHPLTLRYGVGENLYGHAAIAAFRASRTPAQHGARARRLENTIITSFGRDFATANTEYVLLGNGRRGRQSQTWVRTDAGWKVVAAHVSLLADSAAPAG
jgi:ketosteroid isomerase-like protein